MSLPRLRPLPLPFTSFVECLVSPIISYDKIGPCLYVKFDNDGQGFLFNPESGVETPMQDVFKELAFVRVDGIVGTRRDEVGDAIVWDTAEVAKPSNAHVDISFDGQLHKVSVFKFDCYEIGSSLWWDLPSMGAAICAEKSGATNKFITNHWARWLEAFTCFFPGHLGFRKAMDRTNRTKIMASMFAGGNLQHCGGVDVDAIQGSRKLHCDWRARELTAAASGVFESSLGQRMHTLEHLHGP